MKTDRIDFDIDKKTQKELYNVTLPAKEDPEQIIFNRREDGYYNMTIKSTAFMNGNLTEIYEECVVKLPQWAWAGIPLTVMKQEDGALFSFVLPEEEEK